MNSSLGIWLLGAGVAAIGLLLLLGALAPPSESAVSEPEVAPAVEQAEGSSVVVASSSQSPIEQGAPLPQVVYTPVSSVAPVGPIAPCPRCGSTVVVRETPTRSLVGGCGQASTPCGRLTCSTCQRWTKPSAIPAYEVPAAPAVGGCGVPSTPCGPTPCSPVAQQCLYPCADPCRVQKPGINRNMPLCVDECSFLQLRSTVAHPVCEQIRFEWSASKGWFLDPTASDPLFFAPTTQFCNGEDVWITLEVTDATGASYSDVVGVHIRDLP